MDCAQCASRVIRADTIHPEIAPLPHKNDSYGDQSGPLFIFSIRSPRGMDSTGLAVILKSSSLQ
jgi:hypothetical protein